MHLYLLYQCVSEYVWLWVVVVQGDVSHVMFEWVWEHAKVNLSVET